MNVLPFTLAAVCACIPIGWRRWKYQRHQELLAAQLRRSLQGLAHGMRVGVSFLQALSYVAQEGEEPLASEWRRLLQTVNLGTPLSEALDALTERVPIREIRWFVTAVRVTQETGGSLAEILASLADTLQERETLREKIAALTAQGKASGMLLSVIPFLILAVLYLIDPEMVRPLFETTPGQWMLSGVIVLLVLGGLVIHHIVAIRPA